MPTLEKNAGEGSEMLRHALHNVNDISSSFGRLRQLGRELRAGRRAKDYLKQLDWYKGMPKDVKTEWKEMNLKCRSAAMFRDRFALPQVQEKYAAMDRMNQKEVRKRRNERMAAGSPLMDTSPEARFTISSELDTTWLLTPRLGEVEFQESRHSVSLPNLAPPSSSSDAWSPSQDRIERMTLSRRPTERFGNLSGNLGMSTLMQAGVATGVTENPRRSLEFCQRRAPLRGGGRGKGMAVASCTGLPALVPSNQVAQVREKQHRQVVQNLVLLHNPPLGPESNYLLKARPVAHGEPKVHE